MIIGALEIRLVLHDAQTRKDRRRVIASLKDRMRRNFNVSVAEVGGQELIKSATLGVVQVSNDSRYVNGSLDKVVDMVRRFPAVQLVDYHIEML